MKSRHFEHTLGLLVLLCSGTALAQGTEPKAPPAASSTTADDSVLADAREAFRQGSALARQAQWDEALSAFERSYALHAHPVTSYNIAYCERAMGHYTRAHVLFTRALDEHMSAAQGVLSPGLVASARKYLSEITARVARVRVSLKPAGAAVLVDGRPLQVVETRAPQPLLLAGTRDPGPAEVPPALAFDLWLDPGPHVFVVSRANLPALVRTQRYAPGAHATLELLAQNAQRPSRPPNTPAAPARPVSKRAFAAVALGVSAVGLVTGSVAGIAALHKRSELDDACVPRSDCPRNRQSDIDTMNRLADISTAGFITSAVGLGASALFWFWPGSQSPEKQDRYGLWLGPGSARLSGSF